MFSPRKNRPIPPPAASGFVLVSVLLIIALATILVVVASMMSQIERRAAANSGKIEQARLNALFGLDVAIAQLQREAGPDQRITARADILDEDPATTNTTGVNQPYWTGVWKSGTNGLDVVNSGTPQRQISLGSTAPTVAQKASSAAWLVSGTNAAYDPRSFSGVTNAPNADAAVLARNYGQTASNVIAPLVLMRSASATNGAYAYWVGDEGIKARVNLPDPTVGVSPSGDPSRSQLHFLAPQGTAGHKGVPAFNNTDVRSDTNLAKVTTVASLARLSGTSGFGGTNTAAVLPDITTVSRGVIADVRRGGLKKDLTAALESTTAFSSLIGAYGNGANMLYRSASSAGLTVPAVDTGVTPPTDGLLWYNLFFHYNSYKASMPAPAALSGSPTTPTGNGDPASLPQERSFRAYAVGTGPTSKLGSLLPVPIAYRVDIALSSYLSGGVWKLRLHYYPQLVLWNPYSVRLNFPAYQFRRDVGAFATAGTPTTLTLNVAGTALPPVTLNPITPSGRLQLQTKVGDCAALEPGETRVFALDADAAKPSLTAAITFSDLVSNPNMSADFSQYSDVPGFAGVASATSTVNATLSQLKLRCQNVDTFAVPAGLKWPANDGSSTTARYLGSGGWDLAAAASAWPAGLQIQQMNASPRRIIGFYVRQKGLRASSGTNVYSNAGNAVPIFMGNSASVTPVDDAFSYAWQEVYLSPLGTIYQNGQTDVQIVPAGSRWETSFGAESAGAGAPGERRVIRDVPTQPLVSLGQFMHMPAINFRSIGVYEVLGMGSLFVGGSCASPVIDTDKNARSIALGTAAGGAPNMKLFLDDSFLANEALFDRFFFSTVPPQNLNAPGTTYPATWTAFNAANSGATLSDPTKPLLNARIKPYFRDGTAPAMADLRNVDKAAANLMLDGAFNINSTSVAAWKAYLGSLSGNDLRQWDATQAFAVVLNSSSGTPVSRFWSGSGRVTRNQPWSGVRVLSDDELTELTTRIVEQVKTRGPFLSMADFLNRRLGPAGALTRCGTLQAAIDTMSPDINAAAKAAGTTVNATAAPEAGRVPDFITSNMRDASGAAWNTALGMPGYLMQQDLVQALSPAMAARSDTFTVRTYGEARNPRTGAVEGRAWGEAVVQRLPDFVDDSQAPETGPSAMSSTNQTFGRRFKVVSFRWLNENEI